MLYRDTCNNSCCKASNGCSGGYIQSVAKWVIQNGGIGLESSYPYIGKNGRCEDLKSHWKQNAATIAKVYSCTTEAEVKAALDAGHPVDTGMYVYNDFTYYKGGIYEYVTGKKIGGHAVLICGYNDRKGNDKS